MSKCVFSSTHLLIYSSTHLRHGREEKGKRKKEGSELVNRYSMPASTSTARRAGYSILVIPVKPVLSKVEGAGIQIFSPPIHRGFLFFYYCFGNNIVLES